jgi:hypothetical protein
MTIDRRPIFDDAVDRAREAAAREDARRAELIAARDRERAANRAAMPRVAAAMDRVREVFGDGCRLVYAREGGREIGTSTRRNDG